MRIDRRSFSAVLLVAVAASGCAGTAATGDAGLDGAGRVEDRADTAALEAAYWARQQEAKTRFVQADVDFMTGMIGHHAQALVMSALAPDAGGGPAVRTLAARIANAQRDEIETMQTWLRDRGQPVPVYDIEGTALTIRLEDADLEAGAMDHGGMDHGAMGHGSGQHGGMMDHASMPGMLSQAQLDRLATARGAEFDRLFLEYMIQHHGGAVVMVDDLFAADGAGQDEASFRFASDVQVDQRTEIARMQQMLDDMAD